jgi:hypothetical protein
MKSDRATGYRYIYQVEYHTYDKDHEKLHKVVIVISSDQHGVYFYMDRYKGPKANLRFWLIRQIAIVNNSSLK